ncbi:hypothetical protein CEE36_04405 [candidate division TA06 bacterium B3_TA06]|uniref:DUF4365 domain-containing protein n=1 Tax=candidate division TA06 bacterium B3_TA06 TaxID=2012487 RepID=A0A532V7V6_UNCT6|nr:MAG: hypothetical protein CEE36_04405 [candidate division TA06 bacterium B3_TA06]
MPCPYFGTGRMNTGLSNITKGKIGELEVIKTLLSWGLEVYIAAVDEKHTDILIRRETMRRPYLRIQVKTRFSDGEFQLDKYPNKEDFWFVFVLVDNDEVINHWIIPATKLNSKECKEYLKSNGKAIRLAGKEKKNWYFNLQGTKYFGLESLKEWSQGKNVKFD